MNRMISQDWDDMPTAYKPQGIDEIAQAAIDFDWDAGDLRQLGRHMSKIGLDLATAVRVFLNGRPHDFNHMHPDDVPLNDSARCSMLDSLHSRICAGFYLPDPEVGLGPVRHEAQAWINAQRLDRTERREGRWVFDEAKFEAISDDGPRTLIMTPDNDNRPTLLRVLTEPFWR
ncbi:hypothetical protein [Thalassovita sp.]|uniref:hypothetical protein n=1 Tax=Thalassovita sp. TaxID=1979401 RepID=UPI003B59D424